LNSQNVTSKISVILPHKSMSSFCKWRSWPFDNSQKYYTNYFTM